MADPQPVDRVVRATRLIAAPAATIFELIADPARQPEWDGNDNLGLAEPGQRVHAVGEVFTMTLNHGAVRENHVVEFDEGGLIAWCPAEPAAEPPGHLWRWELEPVDAGHTRVTHTYDWSRLTDPKRLERARATTAERLRASMDRLAAVAERS
ncbi:MAG TPA: SRPBCC family protein [Mycobacterium sp.]|nr:SRPBCC family protein [Mycobacterium sp.]HNM10361.1 SRPBCC family protein [Mycobacterium sp.]HNP13581.1 SRPBCC family protein [Mycobacterium sp.]